MTGGAERDFVMRQEATGRGLERRWMESLGREGRGDMEREEATGSGEAMRVELEMVALEGMSPPTLSAAMAAASLNRDFRLGGGRDVVNSKKVVLVKGSGGGAKKKSRVRRTGLSCAI